MKAILLSVLAASTLFAGEIAEEVKTVKVRMTCDAPECKGEFVYANSVANSIPPQYVHKCTSCKREKMFFKEYPFIRHDKKTAGPPPCPWNQPEFPVPMPVLTNWCPYSVFTNGAVINCDTITISNAIITNFVASPPLR